MGAEQVWQVALTSFLFCCGVFGIFWYSLAAGQSENMARTLAVNALVVMALFHLFHSRNLHGTGCSLSSAIATQLARGADLVAAVDAAHHWVRQALLAGVDLRLGAGHGPLNHFHQPIALMNLENTHA